MTPTATQQQKCAVMLLPRLAKQVFRRASEEQLGMPLKHALALGYLLDCGHAPQQELADALGIDANMVVLVLNDLEERGWAERRRDPNDRRRHRVEITAAGRDALRATEKAQRAVEDEVLAALGDDERATLGALLERALSGLERSA